jgi:hypothetical protein
MTVFLDKENDEASDSEEEEPDEIFIGQGDVNIPKTVDRDDDVLEAYESEAPTGIKEEIEPFNLEELNISVPNLKYDIDEYFLEILQDKYSTNIVQKALAICRQFDCYADEEKIVKRLMQDGLTAVEQDARQLLYEISSLILI